MSTPDLVIETRDLRKAFGATRALSGLDLAVPAGSIYALLGRNGAGKTTTMKVLMGMVRPTAGTARVFGRRVDVEAESVDVRRHVAHVGDDRGAWPGFTPGQVLSVSRACFPGWRTDLEKEYLDRFEIPRDRATSSFSRGMRTAFALVLALARGADLLLLDEPTDGLDPAMAERALQAVVRAAADHPGLTVFLSSHRLGDVDRIADRVGILDEGRLVFDAGLDEIKAEWRRIVMTFDGPPPASLRTAPGVRRWHVDGRMLSVLISHDLDAVLERAREHRAREIEVVPATLADVFLNASAAEPR